MRPRTASLSVKRKSEPTMQQVLKSLHMPACIAFQYGHIPLLIHISKMPYIYYSTHLHSSGGISMASTLLHLYSALSDARPCHRTLCGNTDHHLIPKSSLRYGGCRNKDLHDPPNHHLSLRAMTQHRADSPPRLVQYPALPMCRDSLAHASASKLDDGWPWRHGR